jgi:uncharacterized protein (DUF2249 family)
MARVAYRELSFKGGALAVIATANQIIREYQAAGYMLTLRQLYYRFVAGGHIPNKDSEYKRLGEILNRARYAGLVDWDAIEDRTRNTHVNSHWGTPGDIIGSAAYSYAVDKWADQPHRVEVWVEKEALAGIISQVAEAEDCPWIACRGYMSASEMRVSALRLIRYEQAGQRPIILHLGDHDPSGMDMSRDIEERLKEFCWHDGYTGPEVKRIALNMDQVREYNPPPNPAKLTDSRCTGYMERFGDESWELDALPPNDLDALIREWIVEYRDHDLWEAQRERQEREREILTRVSRRWEAVAGFLERGGEAPE